MLSFRFSFSRHSHCFQDTTLPSGCREATHISAYDCKYGLCACFSDTRHFLQCKASCQCYFTVRPFVRCTGQIVVQEEAKISFTIGLQAQLETDLHANISFCMKCWHGDHRASPRRFYLSWCLRQRHGGFNTTGQD